MTFTEGGGPPQAGAWTSFISAVSDPPKARWEGGQIPLGRAVVGNLFLLKRNVLGERLLKSHHKAFPQTEAGLCKNNAPHFSERREHSSYEMGVKLGDGKTQSQVFCPLAPVKSVPHLTWPRV